MRFGVAEFIELTTTPEGGVGCLTTRLSGETRFTGAFIISKVGAGFPTMKSGETRFTGAFIIQRVGAGFPTMRSDDHQQFRYYKYFREVGSDGLMLRAKLCLPTVNDPKLASGLDRFVSGDRSEAPRPREPSRSLALRHAAHRPSPSLPSSLPRYPSSATDSGFTVGPSGEGFGLAFATASASTPWIARAGR